MVVNALQPLAVQLNRQQIRYWADRHVGIGFDQLLIVADSVNNRADFLLRVYNADGSEVEQCGNGARCAAQFVWQKKLSDKPSLRLALGQRVVVLTAGQDNVVCADMGMPEFTPPAALLDNPAYSAEHAAYDCVIGADSLHLGIVSMGNPHAVVVVHKLADYAVNEIGRQIQSLPCFPHGVNVGFMQINNRAAIDLRVCERGVGETQSCASGACAAVAVGCRWRLLDHKVMVHLAGGDLSVDWQGAAGSIQQCGMVETVYDGVIR